MAGKVKVAGKEKASSSLKYVPCVNIDKQADRANFPSDC